MKLHINSALMIDLPYGLISAVKDGKDNEIRTYALEELVKLIDGESEQEFEAQLLGVSVRG